MAGSAVEDPARRGVFPLLDPVLWRQTAEAQLQFGKSLVTGRADGVTRLPGLQSTREAWSSFSRYPERSGYDLKAVVG